MVTPFLRRFAAVWLHVRSRWLYLLLVGVFLLTCGMYVWDVDEDSIRAPKLRNAVSEWHAFGATYQMGEPGLAARPVTPAEASRMLIYRPLADWRKTQELDIFPRLVVVDCYIPTTADDLAWLVRQPNLASLTLTMTHGLSAGDLNQLAASTSLRELRIRDASGYDTTEAIAWPPNLQVVDLLDARALPLHRLQELSRLPRLHTLVVRLDPRPNSSVLSDETVAVLNSFPALRRLYLIEMETAYPNLVREAQRALPGLWVRPSAYNHDRVRRAGIAALVLSLWLAIVCVIVSPQFVTPQSVLWPGYRTPHVTFAVLLLVLGTLIVWGLSWWSGFDPWTAAGMCGGVWAVTGGIALGFRAIDPGMPGFTQPFLAFPVMVFILPFIQVLMWYAPADWDWLLRGEQPLLSGLLMIVGVGVVLGLGRSLTGLYRTVEAYGRGGCPMAAFDNQGWQQWAIATRRRAPAVVWPALITNSTGRLERAIATASATVSSRRRLWAAGAESTALRMGMVVTFFTVFGMTIFLAFGVYGGTAHFDPKLLVVAFGYAGFMLAYMPAVLVLARQNFLASELLRPVSRTDWVRDWFVMFAHDHIAAITLSAGTLLFLAWQNGGLPTGYWVPAVILFAGGWLTFWSGELWLVTHRAAGVLIIVTIAIGLVLCAVMLLVFWRESLVKWLGSLPGVWTLATISVPLGIAMFYGAHRRWSTWELGR